MIHSHAESKKKKNDTNGLIYKIEMHSQTQRTDLRLTKGKGQEER